MAKNPLRPRKAPSQDRSKATVDAIYAAAMQVLEREGSDDPGMQVIAERAGVSVGSIYQYFPTKAALAQAVIRHHLRKQVDAVKVSLEEAKALEAEAAVRALVHALVGNKRTFLKLERSILKFLLRVGDIDDLTALDDEMNGVVEAFIRSRVTRTQRPELAAFVVSNALRSAVLLSVLQKPEQLEDPAFAEELVQLVLGYLAPKR